MEYIKVISGGRITIPEKLRTKYKLNDGDWIKMEDKEGNLIITSDGV